MANYSNLKAAIEAAIKTNGNQEITGQVLQDVLTSIVSVIGANYTFAGVATPSTNPGTPDQNLTYLAMEGGTYTNFNGTVLPAGISLLMWNGTWMSETVMYGDGGVFDISVYKSSGGMLAKFADLAAALDGGNNIPASARKGGMSIKYVQTSDNKYVQFRFLLSGSFTAAQFSNPDNWQGVDNVPLGGSDNLVTGDGIAMSEANMKGMILADGASNEAKRIASAIVDVKVWTDTRYSQDVGIVCFGLYGSNFMLACYSGTTNIGNLYLIENTSSYPSSGIITYEKRSTGYGLFYMRITIDWSRYNGVRFNGTTREILLPNAEDYNSNSYYLLNNNIGPTLAPIDSFDDTDIIRRGLIGYEESTNNDVKAVARCIVNIKCWVKDEYKDTKIGTSAFGVFGNNFLIYLNSTNSSNVRTFIGQLIIVNGSTYPSTGIVTYEGYGNYNNFYLEITIDWSKYSGEKFAMESDVLVLNQVESYNSNSWYLKQNYLKPRFDRLYQTLYDGNEIHEYVVDVNGSGDYTSLRACVDYLNTIINWQGGSGARVNRSIIKIKPGAYDIRSYYTDEEWNAEGFIGLRIPRNCQIIGLGKKKSDVLITCTGESTQVDGHMKSTLNFTDDTYIENVTIYGENVRYAIHDDYSNYIYANDYLNHREIKNVDFIGKNLIYAAVYGAGDAGGARWNFEDCRFINLTDLCCFSVHDRNDTTDQKLADEYSFKNCQFLGNRNGQRLKKNIEFCPLLSGCENKAIIVGCSFDSIRINMDSAGDTSLSSIDVRGWGNTKKYQVYFNTQSGKAFTPKFSDEIIEGLNVDSVNIVWGDYVIADEYNQLTKGTEANHTGIAIEDIAVGDYGAINTNPNVTYVG